MHRDFGAHGACEIVQGIEPMRVIARRFMQDQDVALLL